MKRPHEKESTRRMRRAITAISTAIYRHAHGQASDQDVKDELFRNRNEVMLALRKTLARVGYARQYANKHRPASPGRGEQTKTIRASKIPVIHTIHHEPTRRGQVAGVPNRIRYIHSVCLYVINKRKGPNRGWTLESMADYLAAVGVVTDDRKPWSVERLSEALNPSEAWEMLRR